MFLDRSHYLGRTSFLNEEQSRQIVNKPVNAGVQIGVCDTCCEALLKDETQSKLFRGFLTRKQNEEYRKFCKVAATLHRDGFVVVSRDNYSCHFPLDLLCQVMSASKNNISRLPNGDFKRCEDRKWMPFVDSLQRTQHSRQMAAVITKIISPDLHFGLKAMRNRYSKLPTQATELNTEDGNLTGYSIRDESLLWRTLRLDNNQSPHIDSHHGVFNVVEALTNKYKIKVWGGTHLLPSWNKDNKPTIVGGGKNVEIQCGQAIIFHSNLVHCGVQSCRIRDNFSNLRKRFFDMGNDFRAFFMEHIENQPTPLTDLSLHFTVDPHWGGINVEGAFDTGKTEIFSVDWNPGTRLIFHEHDTDEERNRKKQELEACKVTYKSDLQKGKKDYEDLMKQPWKALGGEPCGDLMNGDNKVLDRLLKCSELKQSEARKSKRLKTRTEFFLAA